MKSLLLFLPLLLFVACDSLTEKTLYTVNDPEWDGVAALQAQKCVDNSSLFKDMTKYSNFSKAEYIVGDIFLIEQDDDLTRKIYVRVNVKTSTQVVLEYSSTDDSTLEKIALFDQTEYQKLQDEFEEAFCEKQYSDNFSASVTSGNFTRKKYKQITADGSDDGDTDDAYIDIRETLKINLSYPLFFYYYNGSKVLKKISQKGDAEANSTSKITISKANDIQICKDADEPCAFSGLATPDCSILIDTDAIENNDPSVVDSEILNASDCTLLKSNQI